MLRLPVTAIVLTQDEERNIVGCLSSVRELCDEVVVVDSGSRDRTETLARPLCDAFLRHPFETYSAQRNWAQATPSRNRWVLHLDADERVSPELEASIRRFFAIGDDRRFAGAMVPRRTVFMGRSMLHGGHYPVFQLRLFDSAAGRCEERLYDQHFLVDGPVTRLEGDLINILSDDLDSWTLRHMRWAAAEAGELSRSSSDGVMRPVLGRNPIARRRWYRTAVFGRTPPFLRAFLYFGYRYVVRRGFLDGIEGLIFHFLHACWFRFYVDAKLWEAGRDSPSVSEEASIPRGEADEAGE